MTIQLKIAARDAHDAFAAYAQTASELQLAASRVGHSNQPMSHREIGAAFSKLHQQGVELLDRALARGQHAIALGQALQAPGVADVLCRFDEQIGQLMSEERSGRIDRRQLDDAIKVTGRAAQERITAIIGVVQQIVAAVEQHPEFGAFSNTSRKSAPTLVDGDATLTATTVSSSPVQGSETEPSADRIPAHQTWTRRWWRTPGESILDGKPIDGKTVSATFAWCHKDEWGIAATYADGKSELIFNTETSSYDGQPDFIHTGGAPEYVIKILGTHLMRRLGRGPRVAAQDPIVIELAKQFPTTSWVSGTRLRQATKLNLQEFAARVEKLIPRFVRKEFSLDPSREVYGLTLPALLLVDSAHAELIEKVFQAIAHRFHADPDAETFERSDLVAVGWTDPDLKLAARLAELSLLVGGPTGDRGPHRMPSDREAIAEAVKQKDTFVKYVMDAAGASRREHYPVQRPWLTAPLWLERDGSQPDYVPGALLWSVPVPGSGSGIDAEARARESTTAESSRFVIGGSLGEGRSADVFRANDTLLHRNVALKFVRNDAVGANALEHARALARVQHPNIVIVYEVTSVAHPDTQMVMPVVVMELVEGIDLAERIGTPIDTNELRRIGDAMLDAIAAYHANNLAHLDLWDHNVVVGHPLVKVLDAIYFDTAALSSTATRTTQQAKDVRSVRDIIEQMLYSGGVSTEVAAKFIHDTARRDLTLAALRAAFDVAVPVPKQAAVRPVDVELLAVVVGNCDEQGDHCMAKDEPSAVHTLEVGPTHRHMNVCKPCLDDAVAAGRWRLGTAG